MEIFRLLGLSFAALPDGPATCSVRYNPVERLPTGARE